GPDRRRCGRRDLAGARGPGGPEPADRLKPPRPLTPDAWTGRTSMTGTTATATRPARYPLTLDLSGRQVLVVGGGRVAARRVRSLIAAAAQVRVLAPEVCDELDALVETGQVQWEQRGYAGPSDLAGAWLVHTATGDPAVDAAVSAD